jgi:hypothetical protein
MSSLRWLFPIRSFSVVGAAMLLFAGAGRVQTLVAQDLQQATAPGVSSSLDYNFMADDSAAMPAAPAPNPDPANGGGGGQYDNRGGGGGSHGIFSRRLTWEAGAGFNAPIGNDKPYITWGGNFTVGAGLRFTKRFSALIEYQFMDNKLPGGFVAAEGTTGGDAHINSITGSPVLDLVPSKWSTGAYVVGGYGYYHKSTNFTDYECCDYYGGYVPVTVGSFTSNQWGANAGLGIYHRMGGVYGDGKARLFAEARYTFIHTPPISQTNGLGTTGLIPVTLGVRF